VVEFATSQNKIVTVLRASWWNGGSIGRPHDMQNRDSSGHFLPQLAQVTTIEPYAAPGARAAQREEIDAQDEQRATSILVPSG
jgi:hypothetical protein